MRVSRARISGSRLSRCGATWVMMTKATPGSGGMALNRYSSASTPPAEAPTPTMGNGLSIGSPAGIERKRVCLRWAAHARLRPGTANSKSFCPPCNAIGGWFGTRQSLLTSERALGSSSYRPHMGRANSPLAIGRLLDRQQHSKRYKPTERRFEPAFDAYEAAGNAFADEAPGLEAATQRIGREREPLHARDAQRGTEAMKAVAIAGGDERRDRLVGVVRVAARIGAAVREGVGRDANGLVMKEPVERGAAPGDRRLDHEHAPARPQHPRGLAEEHERKFEMMQHVDHDDVGGAGVRERKPLGVRDAVEPLRGLNVGRDHVGEPPLEVADAAADFDGAAASAGGGDAIVEILVDQAQDRLALPHAAVVHELLGRRALHHIALMRMNANNTMRSSMKPCPKREIWVSP